LALSPFPCSWLGWKLHRARGSDEARITIERSQ
jgi:hypothetical protein